MKKIHFIIFMVVLIIIALSFAFIFLINPKTVFFKEQLKNENQNSSIDIDNDDIDNKITENRKIRIMIDPGHNSVTKGSKGVLGDEYQVTYKLSTLLGGYLSEDKRFEYLLSRDENNYIDSVKEYALSNKTKLQDILNTKLDFEKRSGNLKSEQAYELYSVRHYAIDNNFDMLISIHFDFTPNKKRIPNTKGFQVIVSPYNKEFLASLSIADIIASNMKREYSVATGITFDKALPLNIWQYYNKDTLIKKGISLRSIVVLGDAFEYHYYKNKAELEKNTEKSENEKNEKIYLKDIPSVLLEAAYIHEADFKNENRLSDIAERIYKSLVQIFY